MNKEAERPIIEERASGNTMSHDYAARALNIENPGAVVVFETTLGRVPTGDKRYLIPREHAEDFNRLRMEHAQKGVNNHGK